MAEYPEGLTLRTVTGSVDPGTQVVLRIPVWLIGPTDDMVYGPRDLKPVLDADGNFTIQVPVNDDPQWTAFQYYVRLQNGNHILKGAMDVPTGAGSVDLADQLIVGATPTGIVDYLDSTDIGARVAGLNEAGEVLDGDGNVVGGGGGAVASVNGQTGVVVLTAVSVGADPTGTASSALTAHTSAGDPHPQYLTASEGSAAYEALGAASSAVSAHVAAGDPHPQYLTTAEGNAAYQPLDGDLTAVAALTPANDDIVQRKAGAWTNRTPAQLKTDLALTKGDVGLGNADNTSDVNKPLSTAATNALALKADLVGGVIPTAQIPAYAITEYLGTVASQAAMLALTGQYGDWAIRSDLGTVFVITGSNPSLIGSWTQLAYPTAPVTSVNSQTGAVVLAKADVGLGNVDNTADASKAFAASQITSGTLAIARIPTGTTGTTVPLGNDARFTDARTPTAHAASHASAGSDPITISESQVTNLVSDLAGKQPLDADLTTIASLTATDGYTLMGVAGVWAARTPAQAKAALAIAESDVSGLVADLAAKQPLDSDLTTIASLTATTGNFMVAQASAWASVNAATAKTALGITEADVANLTTDLAAKAPLASPTFTGTPAAPTAALGTNTTQIATTAFVRANAASINMSYKIYNVLDYSADATGVADSTTAFQNALNAAAPATQGSSSSIAGAVFVPPGTYTVGSLTIPHRVMLFGVGRGSKLVLKASAGSRANMLTNSQNYSSTNDAQSVQIRDLLLDGNKGSNAATWQCGIVLINDTPSSNYEWVDGRHVVQNVLVQNFTGDGIVQQGRGGSIIANNQVFVCDGFGYNVDVDNYLIGCDAGANGLCGFLMHGTNVLSGCKSWFSGAALTSSRYAGNNATALTVTPPSGNSWDGGSLTGGYVFSLANGWGNGFTWRDPSNAGTSPNGNFNGGSCSALSAQDNAGAGFYINGGRITIDGAEADSNSNNGTSNGTSTGTRVSDRAGVMLVGAYNCRITGTSWDRSANLAHQAAALSITGGGTGCRVELGFEGLLNNGTDQMPPLLASSVITNNFVQMMCGGGGLATPSYTATYVPDPFLAETHAMTLTGNVTVSAPKLTGTLGGAGIYLVPGMQLRLMFTQDATGGRTVTLNSVFRLNTKTFSTTASATTCIEFIWDGTNWQAIS